MLVFQSFIHPDVNRDFLEVTKNYPCHKHLPKIKTDTFQDQNEEIKMLHIS